MYLPRAMRYYRLWIYSCNVALLIGDIVFLSLFISIATDFRFQFVTELELRDPTLIYGFIALILQSGVVQLLGCIAALRMDERLLYLYWTSLLCLLLGDIASGIVWMTRFPRVLDSICDHLKELPEGPYWSRLQSEHGCCGVYGPKDINITGHPESCCGPGGLNSTGERECLGCCDAVQDWTQRSAGHLAVVGFCVLDFLKLCFLVILRTELKEMVQKVKVLREQVYLAAPDEASSPYILPVKSHNGNNNHQPWTDVIT